MDRMRYNDIIEELSDYDPSLKAARIGSTVTIGEIVEMAKAIERLQKAFDDDQEVLKGLEQERDAALAEVERLRGVINEASDQAVEPDPWPVGGEIY